MLNLKLEIYKPFDFSSASIFLKSTALHFEQPEAQAAFA